MKKRAIVLDYTGTLNRLADPKGFVQNLKDAGYFTVLNSGRSTSTIEADFPGLPDTFDLIWSKFMPFMSRGEHCLVGELKKEGIETGVFVVDEFWMKEPIEDRAEMDPTFRWRFVHASQIYDGSIDAVKPVEVS